MNDTWELLQRINAPKIWDDEPVFAFSSDLDWASETVMNRYLDLIPTDDLKMTFFVTHHSEIVHQLVMQKRAERGIHPNFLRNSSHGNTFQEVIETCRSFAPEAIGSRSHRVFDVTDVSHLLKNQYGFCYTSNIITSFAPDIKPHLHESKLVQLPVFLEDGTFLFQEMDGNMRLYEQYFTSPGLKIISFHPMNMVFNTPCLKWMRAIKDSMSWEAFNHIDEEYITTHRNLERGIYHIIMEVINFAKRKGFKIMSMNEIYAHSINQT